MKNNKLINLDFTIFKLCDNIFTKIYWLWKCWPNAEKCSWNLYNYKWGELFFYKNFVKALGEAFTGHW